MNKEENFNLKYPISGSDIASVLTKIGNGREWIINDIEFLGVKDASASELSMNKGIPLDEDFLISQMQNIKQVITLDTFDTDQCITVVDSSIFKIGCR